MSCLYILEINPLSFASLLFVMFCWIIFVANFADWVVFLLLTCMSCLHIFEINPLSVVSPAPFLPEGCLFTLSIVPFAV